MREKLYAGTLSRVLTGALAKSRYTSTLIIAVTPHIKHALNTYLNINKHMEQTFRTFYRFIEQDVFFSHVRITFVYRS